MEQSYTRSPLQQAIDMACHADRQEIGMCGTQQWILTREQRGGQSQWQTA